MYNALIVPHFNYNNNDLSIATFIDEFAPILSKLGNEKSETIITVTKSMQFYMQMTQRS